MNEGILVPIAVFAATFGILYVYFTTRNKERMAMIEKGFDPIMFKNRPENAKDFSTLKWSLLLIGVALGIFFGAILSGQAGMEEEPAYFSGIFLFGGIGLLVAHFLTNKKSKE